MKILIYSDVHWCEYSSILRKTSYPYSTRLCNLIDSVNWAETVARNSKVDLVICLGDFFDKSTLNPVEITALNEISWYNDCQHIMLVGNHEMWSNDLQLSSAHIFDLIPIWTVIDSPSIFSLGEEKKVLFLPYILEDSREPISSYCGSEHCDIIFSHNDLQGIQMGGIISKQGFELEDIENHCDICFNGHLHNGLKISNKIINVGNLTGQNFSEDATKYTHGLYIYDTITKEYDYFENPYAYNFYKVEYPDMPIFKKQAVVSYKCPAKKEPEIRALFEADNRIDTFKIILARETVELDEEALPDLSVDHLEEFKNYILTTIGSDEVVQQELYEVCK